MRSLVGSDYIPMTHFSGFSFVEMGSSGCFTAYTIISLCAHVGIFTDLATGVSCVNLIGIEYRATIIAGNLSSSFIVVKVSAITYCTFYHIIFAHLHFSFLVQPVIHSEVSRLFIRSCY
tara:strand:- start:1978 stop:2334 length:357 start_codon:yes stop_codon:yes gene_type:complete